MAHYIGLSGYSYKGLAGIEPLFIPPTSNQPISSAIMRRGIVPWNSMVCGSAPERENGSRVAN